MSFGKGGRKQAKTSSDSVEVTYFSLLVGCADVASPFKGLIPSQSWSCGGLLGLLSLEGKGSRGQAYKAYCNLLAYRGWLQISSQTPLYTSQSCWCESVTWHMCLLEHRREIGSHPTGRGLSSSPFPPFPCHCWWTLMATISSSLSGGAVVEKFSLNSINKRAIY